MKLRFLVPALALALTTIAAHAQVGIYVLPVVSRISLPQADNGPFAFLGDGQTAQVFGGIAFGGYYEFVHLPKADLGVDIRETIQHGNNASLDSFMGGLRLVGKPMTRLKVKPYGQFSVGDGRTTSALNSAHINRMQFAIYGGVDRPLNPHIDWRLIEVSFGEVSPVSSSAFLYNGPALPNARVLGFSTGFVFRFK